MKMLHYIFGVMCAICIFIIILWTSVEMVAYNSNFYMRQYQINNAFNIVHISEEDLYTVTVRMIDYLKLRTDDLNVNVTIAGEDRPFFNQRELDHMVDVQDLFRLFKNIRLICIIFLVLLFTLYKSRIFNKYSNSLRVSPSKMLFSSTCITLILLVILSFILGVTIASDFDKYFIIFHEIFFFNDLWLLNPATDLLINIVPLTFFINITIHIITYFAVFIATVIFCVAFLSGMLPRRY